MRLLILEEGSAGAVDLGATHIQAECRILSPYRASIPGERISVLRSSKNESRLRSFLACDAPSPGYMFPYIFIKKCRNLISTDFNMV